VHNLTPPPNASKRSMATSGTLVVQGSRKAVALQVEIIGNDDQRRMAKLCIDITLQQRNNGKVKVDLEKLKELGEVTQFDVDHCAVGFVLGAKGATLRQFEKMHRTFMFFDNTMSEDKKKKLFILGSKENRDRALRECQNAVAYKLSGNGAQVSSWRERDGGPRYDVNYRRSPPRDRYRDEHRRDDRRCDAAPSPCGAAESTQQRRLGCGPARCLPRGPEREVLCGRHDDRRRRSYSRDRDRDRDRYDDRRDRDRRDRSRSRGRY
jgi:hypothetical protein